MSKSAESNAQVTIVEFSNPADVENNEHAVSREFLEGWCNEHFKYWVFQKEQGDTGYIHWQGAGSLRKKRRMAELKGKKPGQGVMKWLPNHIEPLSGNAAKGIKNRQGLLETYCGKTDTRIDGPFMSQREVDSWMPPQYQGLEYTSWQLEMIAIAEHEMRIYDGRTIHWVYDWTGDHGKSTLAALLELSDKGIDMPSCNDYEKLCASLCDELMDSGNHYPGIIMLDLPRAMSKNQMNGFTTACEQWKKGKVVDMRNHYRKWWFATPSVWIFSNTQPPLSHFSKGRWRVWCFDGPGKEATLIPWRQGMGPSTDSLEDDEDTVFNPLHARKRQAPCGGK